MRDVEKLFSPIDEVAGCSTPDIKMPPQEFPSVTGCRNSNLLKRFNAIHKSPFSGLGFWQPSVSTDGEALKNLAGSFESSAVQPAGDVLNRDKWLMRRDVRLGAQLCAPTGDAVRINSVGMTHPAGMTRHAPTGGGLKKWNPVRRNAPIKFCALASIIFALLVLAVPAMGQGAATVTITTPPAPVEGDTVTLTAVVQDAGGLTEAYLTAANFSVSEPFADMNVTAEATRPIALAVIVNLSAGSDADLIRETLRAYFNGYFRAGDRVTFYILDGDPFRVVNTTDASEINRIINGFSYAPGYYHINNALKAALTDLRQMDSSYSREALYIGSYLNDPEESSTPRIFAAERIPFHVIQAHRFRENSTAAHRAMASSGGGLFANNRGGDTIVDGTAITTLKLLYDTLADSRTIYQISYRTTNPELSEQQTANLTVSLSNGQQASAPFSYTRQYMPPEITITSGDLNPVRTPFRNGAAINFDRLEQPVRVQIAFPGSVVRAVKIIGLEIVDTRTNSVIESTQIPDPPSDGLGGYSLTWSLSDFETPDSVIPVRITVTATDALGLSASAVAEGMVTVGALPPLPTPAPTLEPTAPPTLAPTLAPTPIPVFGAIPALSNNLTQILTAAVAVLALIGLYLFAVLRRTRRTVTRDVFETERDDDEIFMPPPPIAASPPSTTNGSQPAAEKPEKPLYGRLVVIDGLDDLEILINSERFIIGRAEIGCDFRIDLPFISPRHCEFTFKNGNFRLKDMGTKNGTYVNGERVPLERDVAVPIGSEIGITKNIKVELWDPRKVIDYDQKRVDRKNAVQIATRTRTHHGELDFPGLPGIHYIDDDESEVEDDYSPS